MFSSWFLLDWTYINVLCFFFMFFSLSNASRRLVFIVFPDCNIAAPVSFSSGKEASTYIHQNT